MATWFALRTKSSRCEVDDDAILRADEAAVDHCPFDAMQALFHRLLGEADKDGLWQRTGGDVDFDFDREGVDAEQGEGMELGEHGGSLAETPSESRRAADGQKSFVKKAKFRPFADFCAVGVSHNWP